jgi:hypothetical protein
LGRQRDFLCAYAGCQQFEVHGMRTGDNHQEGFVGFLPFHNDRFEDNLRRNAQAARGFDCAEFFGRQFESGICDLARSQQARDVIDRHAQPSRT